jgi:hypothetical protein
LYKVEKVKPEKMSKKLYKQCISLTYRQDGLMSLYLYKAKFKKTEEDSCCYIIQDDKQLLSWAIVYGNEVCYYTRKTHRRKGLGSLLAKAINKDYKQSELVSGVYDKKSEMFYKNYKYKIVNF